MAAHYDRQERKWDERQQRKRNREAEEFFWGEPQAPIVKWPERQTKAELKAHKKARHAARNEQIAILAAAELEREQRYKGDSEFGAF